MQYDSTHCHFTHHKILVLMVLIFEVCFIIKVKGIQKLKSSLLCMFLPVPLQKNGHNFFIFRPMKSFKPDLVCHMIPIWMVWFITWSQNGHLFIWNGKFFPEKEDPLHCTLTSEFLKYLVWPGMQPALAFVQANTCNFLFKNKCADLG